MPSSLTTLRSTIIGLCDVPDYFGRGDDSLLFSTLFFWNLSDDDVIFMGTVMVMVMVMNMILMIYINVDEYQFDCFSTWKEPFLYRSACFQVFHCLQLHHNHLPF